MTVHASKVRIYDLAKELKLETKRLIEELRREGVDVSVPSNSVSKELAEKIRNKYFPKKEASAPRVVRIVKKAARPVGTEDSNEGSVAHDGDEARAPVAHHHIEHGGSGGAATEELAAEEQTDSVAGRPFAARLVKRLAPAARAEQPVPDASMITGITATPDVAAPEVAAFIPSVGESDAPGPVEAGMSEVDSSPLVEQIGEAPLYALPPSVALNSEGLPRPAPPSTSSAGLPGKQIRALRPTTEALNAGIRHGERAPAPVAPPAPAPVSPRERDQRSGGGAGGRAGDRGGVRSASGGVGGRGGFERAAGTPGESANPQTVYTPPADANKRRGARPGARRGGGGGPAGAGAGGGRDFRGGGRGGRFDRNDAGAQRVLSLEERIAGTLNSGGTADSLKAVRLVEGSTVKEFAEKLGIKPKDIVALLLQRGVFATMNQSLNDEVAVDLGRRFGHEVTFVPFEEMVAEEEFEELIATDADDVELPRAPVVTVMGHVDHGKTSLLDAIRTTEVAAGEAGGITQHIGAYSVQVPNPGDPSETRRVVFLDTPGHEAFTLMRARGAKATDIVVLVVAADDGVMPQTIEAIEHSRAAGVPIVVAINKIDRPEANTTRVKQELAIQGLQPVEWGGDIEMVEVSAKKRENLDTLLETILLTADILDLKASPTRRASGVVLEAKLDRGRGSVATVLVQQGTLHVHDPFIVGQVFGKVRAMFDDRGNAITEVGPATPVEVLGLQGVPQAGESLQVVADIARAQTISEQRQMTTRQNTLLATTKRGIEALGEKEVKELLVILKADVQGSVEVLRSTLQKLSTEQVVVKVIRSGAGAITESDVLLASATQAGSSDSAVVILGFNVRPEVRAAELAKLEHVDVRLHSIIYKVEEEIRAAMIGMLEAIEKERILGKAEVRDVFRVPRAGVVAGSMVLDGMIRRNARARLIRDGVVAWEGGIASLRRFKDDVGEVREGFECGIALENFNDLKVGDQIEAYIVEKIAATEL